MRAAVITVFFSFFIFLPATKVLASAEPQNPALNRELQATPVKVEGLAVTRLQVVPLIMNPKEAPKTPTPIVHEVTPNENLSAIAEQFGTTWVRLFDKNEQIADPTLISAGDKITIPLPDEQLPDRPVPEPPIPAEVALPAPVAATVKTPATASKSVTATVRGSTNGNSYTPGYCTWYAKNIRPDLPNNLGNANTWVSRAAAQGLPTGSVPRPGAIGQQGMHVVYIQSVNGDGTVTVSEMNYQGFGVISSRTVSASSFQYIY